MSRYQGPINKNNSQQPLDYILACSIDNFKTTKRHQAFSVQNLPNGLVQLDYSIHVPQPDMSIFDLLNGKFVNLVHSKNSKKKKEAQAIYDTFGDEITQGSFSTEDFKPAYTFGLVVDPKKNYGLIEYSTRNSMVKIDEATTYKNVNKHCFNRAFDSPYKQDMIFWNRFIAAQKKPPQTNINFEEVVHQTTLLVQDIASREGFDKKIEMLHRRKNPRDNPLNSYLYVNTHRAPDKSKDALVAPITCSMYTVSAANAVASAYFKEYAENLYSPEEGHALAVMAQDTKVREPRKGMYVVFR